MYVCWANFVDYERVSELWRRIRESGPAEDGLPSVALLLGFGGLKGALRAAFCTRLVYILRTSSDHGVAPLHEALLRIATVPKTINPILFPIPALQAQSPVASCA